MAGKPGQLSTLPKEMPDRYTRGFAWDIDQRSRTGRDMSASVAGLADHLGGAQTMSLTQLYLCERVAFLERRLRDHESRALKGKPPLLTEGEYLAAVGQLSGLCQKLGLARRPRDIKSLAQVLAEARDESA